MPVGPNEVKQIDQSVEIIQAIDSKLTSGGICPLEDGCYWVVLPGSVNSAEKFNIRVAYLGAGWGRVEVKNSGECGGQGGMISVKLWRE